MCVQVSSQKCLRNPHRHLGVCLDMLHGHVYRHACVQTFMCTDVCIEMRTGTRIGMCVDMRTSTCDRLARVPLVHSGTAATAASRPWNPRYRP